MNNGFIEPSLDAADGFLPVERIITPGNETSEFSTTRLMQYGSGALITGILSLAATTDIAPSIIITALIVATLLAIAPTLHYIASRRSIKCAHIRELGLAERELLKTTPPRTKPETTTNPST